MREREERERKLQDLDPYVEQIKFISENNECPQIKMDPTMDDLFDEPKSRGG
jgi:hypothetical protein